MLVWPWNISIFVTHSKLISWMQMDLESKHKNPNTVPMLPNKKPDRSSTLPHSIEMPHHVKMPWKHNKWHGHPTQLWHNASAHSSCSSFWLILYLLQTMSWDSIFIPRYAEVCTIHTSEGDLNPQGGHEFDFLSEVCIVHTSTRYSLYNCAVCVSWRTTFLNWAYCELHQS